MVLLCFRGLEVADMPRSNDRDGCEGLIELPLKSDTYYVLCEAHTCPPDNNCIYYSQR